MSKAYDRVEWSFLGDVMERMGFSGGWRGRIMRCLSTVTQSFLINGQLVGGVKPSRGLRQGDPISPYLFLLCADSFSRMLCKAAEMGQIHGMRVCRGPPRISHLFFADDSILFIKENAEECLKVANIISQYEQASGQKINFDKSEVVFSKKVGVQRRDMIKELLGFREVDKHEKYLGLPTIIGRSKKVVFTCLKERVWKKVNGWKERLLSRPGKEVLIKAVAQAIPTYMMSLFSILESVIDEIHSVLARFWWGSSDAHRKLHWMRWERLCEPKANGGMGFRDLRVFNQALLAKQVWPLLTKPESLAGRWRVGNGRDIGIWDEAWLPGDSAGIVPTPNINADPGMRVADLIDTDRACWNMEAVRAVLTDADARLVTKLPLSSRLPHDERCALTRTHWDGSGFWEVIEAAPNGSCMERMVWILQQLGEGERGRFLAMMWSIWTIRNQRLFEEAPPPAAAVCSGIVKMVVEYQGYADRVFGKKIVVTEVGGCSWTPPAAGFIKLNVDGHVAGCGVVGLGVVARDMAGRVVGMGCRRVEADWDVEVAEARAASFGLEVANRLGFSNIILESDALKVVLAVKNEAVARSPFGLCVIDVLFSLRSFPSSKFIHVKRGGNTMAHCIARMTEFEGSELILVTDFPQVVITLAELDLI
ncbi:uncharacterized protein LOC141631292 [Silene latifolia]|uniref:uncharacterized protein LOC141631292 n=1 Tax=Silene latifolia TaxID=37657 RepID=UPI003D776544